MRTHKLTLKEMGSGNVQHVDKAPSFIQAIRLQEHEENAMRLRSNKKALDRVFAEIVSVCNQLQSTENSEEKKRLSARFRTLSNKYCFSDGIDGIITH